MRIIFQRIYRKNVTLYSKVYLFWQIRNVLLGLCNVFFFPKWQFRYDRWLDYYIYSRNPFQKKWMYEGPFDVYLLSTYVLSTHNSNLNQQLIGFWNNILSFDKHLSPCYFMIMIYMKILFTFLTGQLFYFWIWTIYKMSASSVSIGMT